MRLRGAARSVQFAMAIGAFLALVALAGSAGIDLVTSGAGETSNPTGTPSDQSAASTPTAQPATASPAAPLEHDPPDVALDDLPLVVPDDEASESPPDDVPAAEVRDPERPAPDTAEATNDQEDSRAGARADSLEDVGPPPTHVGGSAPEVGARGVAVIDAASMTLLHGVDADVSMPPASLTKVATAILAVESGRLDEVVAVDVESYAMPGSSLMGLHPGDEFTLRDLVAGLMLVSGNDAALAIGRHLAGSDAAFMEEIHALLADLGMTHSQFTNPHGLHDESHYASPRDMAVLAHYAMQFPEFVEIVNAGTWQANGSRAIPLQNVNGFMSQYAGADGVKTGFTRAIGQTFIGSATRDGQRVYVVLISTPDRVSEATALLDWAFEAHEWDGGG